MQRRHDDLEPVSSSSTGNDLFAVAAGTSRPARRFIAGILAAVVMAVLVAVLAWPRGNGATDVAPGGDAGNSVVSNITISTAVPRIPGAPFPAFGEWRVVYLAGDSRLHAVSLDGARDTTGLAAPDLRVALGSNLGHVAISADGRLLAYSNSTSHGSGPVMQAALESVPGPSPLPETSTAFARELAWSPASDAFAYLDNRSSFETAIYVARAPFLAAPTIVPGSRVYENGVTDLEGWLDATHLLVLANNNAGNNSLAALDITSGAVRPIATIPLTNPRVMLNPERTSALVIAQGSSPHAEAVDLTSGAVRELPRIAAALPGMLLTDAWQPSAMRLAITAAAPDGDATPASYLLDLGADTITPLDGHTWVWGWSPDGAALILGTPLTVALPGMPPALLALSIASDGTIRQQVTLTNAAIGFVGFAF
ncbi:MAG: hypothetical protein ACHQ4H_17415 [Ktedonobacterales bacterium]